MSTFDPSGSYLNLTLGYPNDFCAQIVKDPYDALLDALSDPVMSGTFNPDVLGYGVRLSNFIINICAGILIRWGSAKDARDAIRNTLFQIGAIVLCTLISIVRDQLYFFDGLFTLKVVHSPIAWYILWINGRELYSWIRRRDKAIPANPFLCLALVCGWISLNLVVWFKGRKFSDDNCGSTSFNDYFSSVLVLQLPAVNLDPSVVIPFCGASYFVFCLRYIFGGQHYILTNPAPVFKSGLLVVQFVFTHHKWPLYMAILESYYNWFGFESVWWVEPGYSFTYGQSLSVVAAATSVYPVLKLFRKALIKARRLTKEDFSRIYFSFISELVFLFFGSNYPATAINRKFFRKRLTLPPCEFRWNELPVTRPPTPTSLPVAIPLIQIDSTASGGNTVLAQVESSSGPAAVAYLDVPIPSSEMDITTTPLPLHEGDVPPTHAPSPGEEVTLPSVPRSASPLQPPRLSRRTHRRSRVPWTVSTAPKCWLKFQLIVPTTILGVVKTYPAQLAIPRACPHRSFMAHWLEIWRQGDASQHRNIYWFRFLR
ncbi:hypothetical protein B0H13DRAFT_2324480 [Mycena leptocephala]|nr:hypothetical protein B0H13DRAFT_2324480 [Mycena leptocephala]